METNEIEVGSVDPIVSMMGIENSGLAEIAVELKEKPLWVIASL